MWPADQAWRVPVDDFPPRWASAWGDDRYGLWADLVVGGVTQRMRWIEPTGPDGFWMGSTAAQVRTVRATVPKGYREDYWRELVAVEFPRHRVFLRHGYWLADTPCTQAFWEAVTRGEQPSYFRFGPDVWMQPVENVSWLDVDQNFLVGLHTHGLPLEHDQACLPTDAQWEYACRAGSAAAYHWGDDFDPALANVDHGAGAWRQPSPVKRYAPNAWGLYDMHGNVWEWCADGRLAYTTGDSIDPVGPGGTEVHRVLRGGSFEQVPAAARSAFARRHYPVLRLRDFGFRLALRSPNPGPEGPAPGGARPRPAEPG